VTIRAWPHLAVGVAGLEAGVEAFVAALGEAFAADEQPPADAEPRVVFAAAVAGRLALHAPADVVERLVGQPHDMKRVDDDLGRVESADQGVAITAVRIQGDALDRGQPLRVAAGQPGRHGASGAALDHVQQAAAGEVEQAGDIAGGLVRPGR
jgi:hypothetical protein